MKYVLFMGTMNFFFLTSPKMVEKVKDLISTDARCTSRYIAKCVGISLD
jgi:hypothetical protein